jgi:hypothetical protein
MLLLKRDEKKKNSADERNFGWLELGNRAEKNR